MILITFLILSIIFIIWWIYDNKNYFKKRNVKYLKSNPILGALSDSLLKKCSIFENIVKNYNTPELKDEPYYGMFNFHRPALSIKDPELIKRILVTDFQSFNSRFSQSGSHDPIGYYHTFLSDYSTWKNIRQNLSKFFTSAKLKSAFYHLEHLSNDLNEYLNKRLINDQVELPIRFFTEFFSVDVIANIALGIEATSLKNSGSEFHKVAESMWEKTPRRMIELVSILIFPDLGKILKSTIMGKYADDFLYTVAPKIIEEREKSGIKRNDLIDILIDMKKDLKPQVPGHTVDHILVSQIATFLQAGYETTSATMIFTFYELSKNLKVQNRLREEIKEMLMKNEGKISYENVAFSSEMPYMQQVIKETMRLYPAVPVLERKCTNPEGYSLEPFGDFHVPFGMSIQIPTFAISRDEKYFPEPLKFDPERFNDENIQKFPPFCHIPFGGGPHNCIGEKLALIEIKIALCAVLKNYRVEVTERTPKEIVFDKNAIAVRSKDEIILNFVKDPIW